MSVGWLRSDIVGESTDKGILTADERPLASKLRRGKQGGWEWDAAPLFKDPKERGNKFRAPIGRLIKAQGF